MGSMWGWVDLKENGEINEILDLKYDKAINKDALPDWVKTKMAMLDFMDKYKELPCGSYWNMSVNTNYKDSELPLKTYFIHED